MPRTAFTEADTLRADPPSYPYPPMPEGWEPAA